MILRQMTGLLIGLWRDAGLCLGPSAGVAPVAAVETLIDSFGGAK